MKIRVSTVIGYLMCFLEGGLMVCTGHGVSSPIFWMMMAVVCVDRTVAYLDGKRSCDG